MQKIEKIEKLRSMGFIHITGLTLDYGQNNPYNGRPVSAHRRSWGKSDSNNGIQVAILPSGEVFLSLSSNVDLRDICPNGNGANVPCSNGEGLSWYQMLARVSNHVWTGNGTQQEYPADPEQAEYFAERWDNECHSQEVERARKAGALAESERQNPTQVKVSLTAVG